MPTKQRSEPISGFQTDQERWVAIQNRSRSANGKFVYAVKTTGVYCRPTCSSRVPLRKNVRFFATGDEAERAGFRACKRCLPSETNSEVDSRKLIVQACKEIERLKGSPDLTALAAKLKIAPTRLQRLFRKQTGLSIKAYADALRGKRVSGLLRKGANIAQTIVDSDYNSAGRFYADSKRILGMSPTRYQAGGDGETIRFGIGESSLGAMLVAMTDKGICSILLGDDPGGLLEDLQDRFPKASFVGGDAEFEQYLATVIGFVEDPHLGWDLPLDIRGTAFQQRVWKALCKIPPGRTATYTEIARRIKSPQSVRAVATACAANPIAVAIPCHRVVRLDGSLSGYRWGVERKAELLQRESQLQRECLPKS